MFMGSQQIIIYSMELVNRLSFLDFVCVMGCRSSSGASVVVSGLAVCRSRMAPIAPAVIHDNSDFDMCANKLR